MFFTSIPIMIYAVFDREFSSEFLEHNPAYYDQGIKSIYNHINNFIIQNYYSIKGYFGFDTYKEPFKGSL